MGFSEVIWEILSRILNCGPRITKALGPRAPYGVFDRAPPARIKYNFTVEQYQASIHHYESQGALAKASQTAALLDQAVTFFDRDEQFFLAESASPRDTQGVPKRTPDSTRPLSHRYPKTGSEAIRFPVWTTGLDAPRDRRAAETAGPVTT